MKKSLSILLSVLAVTTVAAHAQVTESTTVTEVTPTQTTTTSTTTKSDSVVADTIPVAIAASEPARITTTTTVERLDPVVARRHLSVTPLVVTITPEQRAALDRTVLIESRPVPVRRIYNMERNVVIVEADGRSQEFSYVALPVLFAVDTANLLDAESRDALTHTADVIKEVMKQDPNALFDVEGHTSEEGTAEHNMLLSVERSKRIFAELTQRYGVPPSALTAHGYGQNFALYPNGTEGERQADRRVLVVRTR